jgi:NAD(P)-dependent dehydrogenase (short-subunit alcohol dehydrogenase family)
MALSDATVVLTGATTGIGRATALQLAGQVDRLIVHGPQTRDEVAELLERLPGATYLQADFSTRAGVEQFAAAARDTAGRVDLLINNAARPGPARRTVSQDGNELTLQINYLAPVLLTERLLDITGRIVNIASATHLSAELWLDDLQLQRHQYAASTAYAHSKVALVTYSCWLARRAEVVSMHPGVIATELLHSMFAIGGDSPEHAAANVIAVARRSADTGTYYDEQRPAEPNPVATRPDVQDRLHRLTSELLGLRS